MRKKRHLLIGLLCAALLLPSFNVGAVVINRHSMDNSNNDEEESSHLDTKIEEVITNEEENETHIEKKDIVEPADVVFVLKLRTKTG